ncbi:uncharacterized protein BT62DRAFT_376561 [Guyanagaster necrorhizus]|uniref:Uncharacterized protein n=1 Tax=Guyanagaster necrorhizus TaxID=856835 RepID=A0A9P8AP46_9AGAR|nr:uncharacterized protein BT62DRAFT_376561 [Guyanagaster necrorhizus MCA 3950]KAG7442579.1 hypothetical protein BT62DRAFT_376561 [Guyanagaster necrorhizus MCA 3950]
MSKMSYYHMGALIRCLSSSESHVPWLSSNLKISIGIDESDEQDAFNFLSEYLSYLWKSREDIRISFFHSSSPEYHYLKLHKPIAGEGTNQSLIFLKVQILLLWCTLHKLQRILSEESFNDIKSVVLIVCGSGEVTEIDQCCGKIRDRRN